MQDLALILALFIFVAIFGLIIVILSSLLGPKIKGKSLKNESYECGLPAVETGSSTVSVKFYLTAILFILFDIEIIFMFPFAITFKEFIAQGQGPYIMASIGLFLAVFIFGLWWEVKSKALEWE
jgi:NADH-quinone oxidoreductase subunit A